MNKLYIIDQTKLLLTILGEEYTDTFYLCFYVILDFGSESGKVYTEWRLEEREGKFSEEN